MGESRQEPFEIDAVTQLESERRQNSSNESSGGWRCGHRVKTRYEDMQKMCKEVGNDPWVDC